MNPKLKGLDPDVKKEAALTKLPKIATPRVPPTWRVACIAAEAEPKFLESTSLRDKSIANGKSIPSPRPSGKLQVVNTAQFGASPIRLNSKHPVKIRTNPSVNIMRVFKRLFRGTASRVPTTKEIIAGVNPKAISNGLQAHIKAKYWGAINITAIIIIAVTNIAVAPWRKLDSFKTF